MNKENRAQEWSHMCDEIFKSFSEMEKVIARIKAALVSSEEPQQKMFTIMKEFVEISHDAEFLMDDAELWHKLNEIEDFIYTPNLTVVK
jgi:hypothetical protein